MKLTQTHILKKESLYGLGLLLAFCLVYFKLMHADFMSWDDAEYVLENKDVHSFHLKALTTHFYAGNFHPLTMLSYALDWKVFQANTMGYHIENIGWHFLNSILVYYTLKKLLKEQSTALLISIVFAFHPLQVETVAWIAERKNLLSTFFILLSILSYIHFLSEHRSKFFVFSLLFFIFSLLSKPSFIIFPLILLLIDWHFHQSISIKNTLQKIPFLIGSLVLGIVTWQAQKEGGYINENHFFAFHERIGYAGYAILQYLIHFVNPFQLSVIYPYPQNKMGSIILGYVVLVGLAFLIYKLKKHKKTNLLFGLCFFLINVLLVLQFIPFGEVLNADRYMYVSIIGLGWIVFHFIPINKKALIVIALFMTTLLGSITTYRLSVWQNSMALYKDILKKYPHSYMALNSIGAEYMKQKEYRLSEKYYNQSIYENRNSYKTYYNRALLYSITQRLDKAINDYTKAIELTHYYKAYIGRANVYYILKDYSKSMADAEKALSLNKNNMKANFVLANCYDDLNQLDKALIYYNTAILLNNEDASLFLRRGVLYGKQQQFKLCLTDLEISTTLNPNYAEAYYWKGVAKFNLNKNPCFEFSKALNLGFDAAQIPLEKYCH